jgi:hypothetical protein
VPAVVPPMPEPPTSAPVTVDESASASDESSSTTPIPEPTTLVFMLNATLHDPNVTILSAGGGDKFDVPVKDGIVSLHTVIVLAIVGTILLVSCITAFTVYELMEWRTRVRLSESRVESLFWRSSVSNTSRRNVYRSTLENPRVLSSQRRRRVPQPGAAFANEDDANFDFIFNQNFASAFEPLATSSSVGTGKSHSPTPSLPLPPPPSSFYMTTFIDDLGDDDGGNCGAAGNLPNDAGCSFTISKEQRVTVQIEHVETRSVHSSNSSTWEV